MEKLMARTGIFLSHRSFTYGFYDKKIIINNKKVFNANKHTF